ncbi:hypothetical protein [Streptomyces sp. NPDC003023]
MNQMMDRWPALIDWVTAPAQGTAPAEEPTPNDAPGDGGDDG